MNEYFGSAFAEATLRQVLDYRLEERFVRLTGMAFLTAEGFAAQVVALPQAREGIGRKSEVVFIGACLRETIRRAEMASENNVGLSGEVERFFSMIQSRFDLEFHIRQAPRARSIPVLAKGQGVELEGRPEG